ncbi:MAG: hypothetical protein IPQ23_02540 [Cytophagaceae bacterium]|nr:hypothetical protein [Cytophagaceae bacterium]
MKYLFDSNGNWIAFKISNFIFNTNCNNIAWLPWNDDYVVDLSGNYLGHIYGNRFYKHDSVEYRGFPGYPDYPGYVGHPGFPEYAGYVLPPLGCSDITKEQLNSL